MGDCEEMKDNIDNGTIRSFDTGATRDTSAGKIDPEGFVNPLVMRQFYKFMNMHRIQSDGNLRDSDNWQKGIETDVYMKSLHRHEEEVWLNHRGYHTPNNQIANLCGVLFNTFGYIFEILRERDWELEDFDGDWPIPEIRERLERLESKNESE